MSRRLPPVPKPKLDIDRKANSDIEVREMTAEERTRLEQVVPKERNFMVWKPTKRKEVGD